MAQGLGHRLLTDQENLVTQVIVVGQDNHRHILIRLIEHQVAESAPAAGVIDLAVLEAGPHLIADRGGVDAYLGIAQGAIGQDLAPVDAGP